MSRIVLFLVIGALASFWLAPHTCTSYVRTGETVDLSVVEDPATGGASPGPGVVPISRCESHDERWPLRASIALGIGLGLALLAWWNRPQRAAFGDYLTGGL